MQTELTQDKKLQTVPMPLKQQVIMPHLKPPELSGICSQDPRRSTDPESEFDLNLHRAACFTTVTCP